jgi:hypothetical protein
MNDSCKDQLTAQSRKLTAKDPNKSTRHLKETKSDEYKIRATKLDFTLKSLYSSLNQGEQPASLTQLHLDQIKNTGNTPPIILT